MASDTDNPVLNTPFEEPRFYWKLDEQFRQTDEQVPGRRPSGDYLTAPLAQNMPRRRSCQHIPPHPRINNIREQIRQWRSENYPGARQATRRLLEYWASDSPNEPPFFAQREAMETIIWLLEVKGEKQKEVQSELAQINACWNDSINRIAVKMATGTGKTRVMAMLLLWLALTKPEGAHALIICPSLTVQTRLQELDPASKYRGEIYANLMPRGDQVPLAKIRVTILNFHKFLPRSELTIAGPDDKPSATAKKLIWGTAGPPEEVESETPEKMMNRLLTAHRGEQSLIVINDEAHHCYGPAQDREGTADAEAREEEQNAGVWYSALKILQQQGRLEQVFDLSATPMWLRKPKECPHPEALFPWTVSDCPLIEAVEAGLTKVPRVPVSDDAIGTTTGEEELPAYRNTYKHLNGPQLDVENMPRTVRDILAGMERSYLEFCDADTTRLPVMIVVANTTKNADALYSYLAGSRDGSGKWRPSQFQTFSNVTENGNVKAHPPTLLKHSKTDEEQNSPVGQLQKDFFSPLAEGKEPTKKERNDWINQVFDTVGQKGAPGEHVRLIVSVSMLTEGWDVRTVSHVFGFRAFDSQLLCEQVVGRALRRTNFPKLGQGEKLQPQYALVCGVPFDWVKGSGTPPPPSKEYDVLTLKNREHFRIEMPSVIAYRVEPATPAIVLDEAQLAPFQVAGPQYPQETIVTGVIGQSAALKAPKKRKQKIVYELAKQAMQHFGSQGDVDKPGNRNIFAAMVVATKTWLAHPRINLTDSEINLLDESGDGMEASRQIARCCAETKCGRPRIYPVFADDRDKTRRRSLDTGGVYFSTALKNRYPSDWSLTTKKSELNCAACHSGAEAQIAELLDRHPAIAAWARNYNLGWTIPYLDRRHGIWRNYEPDFIARIKNGNGHLLIEYKGEASQEIIQDARIKEIAAEDWWCPAVSDSDDATCNGAWLYVYLTQHHNWPSEIASAASCLGALPEEPENAKN